LTVNSRCRAKYERQIFKIQQMKNEEQNIEKQEGNGVLPCVSVSDVHSFLEWLNNQQHDYMGGEFLYDVKGYYKRLKQGEMFDYWLERVHSR